MKKKKNSPGVRQHGSQTPEWAPWSLPPSFIPGINPAPDYEKKLWLISNQ